MERGTSVIEPREAGLPRRARSDLFTTLTSRAISCTTPAHGPNFCPQSNPTGITLAPTHAREVDAEQSSDFGMKFTSSNCCTKATFSRVDNSPFVALFCSFHSPSQHSKLSEIYFTIGTVLSLRFVVSNADLQMLIR